MASDTNGNILVRLYRRYVGPGTAEQAIGYWLFVIGALAGVVGVGVFLYSTSVGSVSDPPYDLREIAVVLSSLGLALLMLGVVYRLPVQRRVRIVGIVGMVITFLTTFGFVWAYPGDWNAGADYSAELIAAYALGIGLVVIAALVLPSTVSTPSDAFEELADIATGASDGEAESSRAEFEVYEDVAGEHRWRLRHDNGNIIAAGGQGYSSKQKAKQGLESVRSNAAGASIAELSRDAASQATFEVFGDAAGEHRWRLRHDNGHVIADSGEGYAERSGAKAALERVQRYATSADAVHVEDGAFDVYPDQSGEWRWRLLAPNGRIIADSGEGYSSRSNAMRAVSTVRDVDAHEFEVYEDSEGEYRWRLTAANGEIIADSGQGYSRESSATDAVDRVREYVGKADALTLEDGAFDIYRDEADEWRWRLLAPNGEIIGDGGEGYSSRAKAWQGVQSVRRNAPGADIEEV